jgi:hypothetical protein
MNWDPNDLHVGERILLVLDAQHVEAMVLSTDFAGDGSGVIAVALEGVPRIVTFTLATILTVTPSAADTRNN